MINVGDRVARLGQVQSGKERIRSRKVADGKVANGKEGREARRESLISD